MHALIRTILAGAGAGAAGGIAQPLIGKLEEALFFPKRDDTNVPLHFVNALADRVGVKLPAGAAWTSAAGFHVGYALFWGTTYALLREKKAFSPLVGGLGLGGVLYAMAFSRIGAGVQSGAEPHPDARPWRYWLLHTTMPLTFGLTTAFVYERLRRLGRKQGDEPAGTGDGVSAGTQEVSEVGPVW